MADREAVKVIVRCRPLSDKEIRDGRQPVVLVEAGQVAIRSATEGEKSFTFDQAFGADSRQEDVYDAAAAPLVEAMLEGFNSTVFAYGQTGCGKTHTMEGREQPEERGIIPRAFDHIFREIEKGAGGRQFLVRVSHLEIYNEEVRDLLSRDAKSRVELRESPGQGVHVRGLKEFVVKSAAEMAAVLEVGKKNRTVGATLMNQDSSRSHSIFAIVVETGSKEGEPAAAAAGDGSTSSSSSMRTPKPGGIRVGKLNLVDLAGSERQAKTGATGARLKEATKINLSLSALGNVIGALTDEAAGHVPYRDSKLTRLLQDSLGGNSKTVMIANVGPADYNFDETLSTLRYASRAKFIKNKPRINEDPKDAMLRDFQAEIARLKAELEERQQRHTAGPANDAGGVSGGGGAAAAAVDALAEARQAVEQEALLRLEAERQASTAASQEQQQQHAAQLAAHQAELRAYAAEREREQQEKVLLEQRIQAMESKVLRGGVNLLEEVDALEAAAAQQAAELEQERAAVAAAAARAAELEQLTRGLEVQYSSVQEELEAKTAHLQRVTALLAAARQEAAAQAAQHQAERQRLQDDVHRLIMQAKQKDLVIGAYIPPEYQQLIMSRCHWEENTGSWSLDHVEWTGNLVRARREASVSGSEASSGSAAAWGDGAHGDGDGGSGGGRYEDADGGSWGGIGGGSGGGVLHGASDTLANVYFSYSAVADAAAFGAPGRRPGSSTRGGSPLVGGRPRTTVLAARQALRRPISSAMAGAQWG